MPRPASGNAWGSKEREVTSIAWQPPTEPTPSPVRLEAIDSEGVPPGQLVAVSQGENQPIASNDTPEGRSQNRRIDVRIRPIVRE